MIARPILFTDPSLLRALAAGTKTQTRRVLHPQPPPGYDDLLGMVANGWWAFVRPGTVDPLPRSFSARCRQGVAGDLLWVKEAIYLSGVRPLRQATHQDKQGQRRVVRYVSDMDLSERLAAEVAGLRQRSPLLMPRWASRSTLQIVEVLPQRLHAITEEDAVAEGLPGGLLDAGARLAFRLLWDEINGRKGKPKLGVGGVRLRGAGETQGPFAWKHNPWVWRITFSLIKEPA